MNIFVDMKSGFKKVRNLDLKIHAVVKSNNNLSIKEIGQVTYGDFSRPISVISYQNKEADCKTFINAAIHGDEPASALSVITLIEILLFVFW